MTLWDSVRFLLEAAGQLVIALGLLLTVAWCSAVASDLWRARKKRDRS